VNGLVMSDVRRAALRALTAGPATNAQVAHHTGLSRAVAWRALRYLTRHDLVTSDWRDDPTRRTYTLTPAGAETAKETT